MKLTSQFLLEQVQRNGSQPSTVTLDVVSVPLGPVVRISIGVAFDAIIAAVANDVGHRWISTGYAKIERFINYDAIKIAWTPDYD